jgi:hypothetical protein
MRKHWITLLVGIMVIAVGPGAALAAGKEVAYPEGYRLWAHVKSVILEKGHKLYDAVGGIHHVYANPKALKAMQQGKPYPDGSILIFDLLEAKSEDNAISEGPRKMVAVMQKNAKKYPATGGWGFEAFKGDTKDRIVKDMGECFKCHEPKKATDYVFSTYRK